MSLLKRIESKQNPSRPAGSGGTPGTPQESRLAQRRPGTAGPGSGPDIKTRVQQKLLQELDPSMDVTRTAEVRATIEGLFESILQEEGVVLSRADKSRMFEQIVAEILGLGPLETLLSQDNITEVMVNGPKNVYVEMKGRLTRAPVAFENDDHLLRIIDRIVSPLGRRIDESSPYVDARLQDGSRVNAVIPPISLVGPVLTIRKFFKKPLTIEDLINNGSLTPDAVEFLRAAVIARANIVVSGGTGSGKTTLLNILSGFIPADERIVTIEDSAELQLRQEHIVTLETRPANIEGKGAVTIRDLVKNSLRMRPDRIVVGEIRDGAALDMLQAMNTGHDGSLTTAHSNGPRDTIRRLETMTMMAGMELPQKAIREQIASAVNFIVHAARLRDGSRRVTHITELQGMEGETITMTDIFIFEQMGIENGKVVGRLRPTGLRPRFMEEIENAGLKLPASVFGIGTVGRR